MRRKERRTGMSNHEKKLCRNGLIGRRGTLRLFKGGSWVERKFEKKNIVVNGTKSFEEIVINGVYLLSCIRRFMDKIGKDQKI